MTRTSAGRLIELEAADMGRFGGFNVVVTDFAADGWQARRGHWNPRWQHRAPADERSLGDVVAKTAEVPMAEADRLASKFLEEWPRHKPSREGGFKDWLAVGLLFVLAIVGMAVAISGLVWLVL